LGLSFAPGELVSLFGANLGPADGVAAQFDAAANRLPVSLAGTSVTWGGAAAPVLYVRHDQVNIQVPYEVAGASQADVVVTASGLTSNAVRVSMQPTRPNLFPRVFHADWSLVDSQRPASPGEVVVLFATGQGLTTPASVTGSPPGAVPAVPEAPVEVLVGGVQAGVLFRGQTPGTVGLMQLNVRLPAGSSGDSVEVVLMIGGVRSSVVVRLPIR
jgi:uncharacterized protein (TIGR03437 family)